MDQIHLREPGRRPRFRLNASSLVAGSFSSSPVAGTVLNAGSQTLSVSFTPTDTTDYTSATASVTLTVSKATPKITWAKPAMIIYGTRLNSTQLDAKAAANVKAADGTYAYTPKAGTALNAGTNLLTVVFMPTDTSNYKEAKPSVDLTVNKAAQEINFAKIKNQTYAPGLTITLRATDGASGKPVVFSLIEGVSRGSITGDKLTIKAAGNIEAAANQAGDANYHPAVELTQKFAVTQGAQSIKFNAPSTATEGLTIILKATASSGLPVSFAVSGPAILTGSSLKFTGTGTVTLTASEAGNVDYISAPPVKKVIIVSAN
jgi:hypothetical protein